MISSSSSPGEEEDGQETREVQGEAQEVGCAEVDGGTFLKDGWRKSPDELLQGDGITMILEGGKVFERAGCGFSHVAG